MDTSFVKILNESDSKNYLPYLINFIFLIIGFVLGFLKDFFTENKRLRDIKKHLIFNLDILEKAIINQIKYIDEFKSQFKLKEMLINPIGIDTNFHLKNINVLSSSDIFKIFINKSKKDINVKSKIYKDYNYIIRVVEKVFNSVEPDMNKYLKDANIIYDKFNEWSTRFLIKFNTLVNKKKLMETNDSENNFVNETFKLYNNCVENKKINNIFCTNEDIYEPALILANKLSIVEFINLLSEGAIYYKQFKFIRERYYENYDRFNVELKDCLISFATIKNELM